MMMRLKRLVERGPYSSDDSLSIELRDSENTTIDNIPTSMKDMSVK